MVIQKISITKLKRKKPKKDKLELELENIPAPEIMNKKKSSTFTCKACPMKHQLDLDCSHAKHICGYYNKLPENGVIMTKREPDKDFVNYVTN